jgi:predicted RNase H-like HicB family nuclease
MIREFTGIIAKHGKWYVGYVEELPGANTQGRTLKEVRANLKEAITLIIEANKELSSGHVTGEKIIREPIVVEI